MGDAWSRVVLGGRWLDQLTVKSFCPSAILCRLCKPYICYFSFCRHTFAATHRHIPPAHQSTGGIALIRGLWWACVSEDGACCRVLCAVSVRRENAVRMHTRQQPNLMYVVPVATNCFLRANAYEGLQYHSTTEGFLPEIFAVLPGRALQERLCFLSRS